MKKHPDQKAPAGCAEGATRLQELASVMLRMLRDLNNNYGWDELGTTLDAVEAEASALHLP